MIRVSSGPMRTQVIKGSYAYGIGIAPAEKWAREHHIRCIPILGFSLEIGCIRRAGEQRLWPEELFMKYLKEELEEDS